MFREHGTAERIDLDLPFDFKACSFKPKIEPSDPCEQTSYRQHWGCRARSGRIMPPPSPSNTVNRTIDRRIVHTPTSHTLHSDAARNLTRASYFRLRRQSHFLADFL